MLNAENFNLYFLVFFYRLSFSPTMRTIHIILLSIVILASSLQARRFTDAEKKLNAIKNHQLSVEKWKKLYSLKPASEQPQKPQKPPTATVTQTEEKVSSAVSNKKPQPQQQSKPLKPSPPKQPQYNKPQPKPQPKPAPTIQKDPKEEKQKKERYLQ